VLEGNEEFNFDEVSFKPLTKGLGFHKKEPPSVVMNSAQIKSQPFPKKLKGHQVLPSKGHESLGTFYGHSNTWQDPFGDKPVEEEESTPEKSVEFCEALHYEKLFSFLADLIVILGLVSITFLCFFYFSPMTANQGVGLLSSFIFLKAFLILFSVYFLTYFSFFDLSRSPGKDLFNLKLIGVNGGQLTFKQTFLRSIIALISFLVAFLPLIVDFHGKLSDSRLVKNEQKSD